MHRNPSRPLSPHLTIWRWGPHMLVSILHRVTGSGLATIGAAALVWWLAAAASGPEAYGTFVSWATSWIGIVIGVGLSWAFFQHTLSGIRHLVMDIGAGFELSTNKFWANMTLVGSALLTALFWFVVLGVK
ncbi:succinate dehydrogenase, cytochrome b556 subunit [Sphingomonas parva]|uniref:Succinate dehydrogenase cytochrome b556 subunit n=1 Tax=Sphingomonas parva TaxID=2555898 RepID=A0A4Y8ZTZ7_9SPHN|nr:succinate dehydrogenase, cytochrome b556 subunit [Sphingomonas parva]TFI58782.1 succinate dehydrogenase, cytochrome b556 subunit [Sphingomonas parva]